MHLFYFDILLSILTTIRSDIPDEVFARFVVLQRFKMTQRIFHQTLVTTWSQKETDFLASSSTYIHDVSDIEKLEDLVDQHFRCLKTQVIDKDKCSS